MEIRINQINLMLPHSRTSVSLLLTKAVRMGKITRIKNGIYLDDQAFRDWVDSVNSGEFTSTQKEPTGVGKGRPGVKRKGE